MKNVSAFAFFVALLLCSFNIESKNPVSGKKATITTAVSTFPSRDVMSGTIKRLLKYGRNRNVETQINVHISKIPVVEAKQSSVLMIRVNSITFLKVFLIVMCSENDIGILGSITPAVTLLVSPLWGAFADITGKHKLIMIITFIGSVLARCSLMLPSRNIYWLGFVVGLSAILNAPVKPLMDSAVMSMLVDKSTYGQSRLFGQLGFGVGSWIAGPLLAGKYMKYIFPLHAIIAVPTALVMLAFNPKPQEKQQNTELLAAVKHALTDTKFIVFFYIVFIIGLSSGIAENFAYVRLAEVGAVGHVLGVCKMASSLAGCPTFWYSSKITKTIGVDGVLSVSLLSYILRLVIYAAIRSPWEALPAEIVRGLTFGTFWSSSTYYVYSTSPKGLTATMLSLLNAVYHGLGQSTGSLVGGFLSSTMGIAKSFYLWSVVDALMLGLYLLYQAYTRAV